ncbi:hypothetical protein ACFKHW_21235 [Bradyrhizobium lupini]|uniref:hypothetical protein n=1 Tax=Rhizobium lupini TaxID=136996 RepID=UPI0036727556
MSGDWKAQFDALVTETKAHTEALNWEARRPRAQPREAVERIGLNPLDYGGSERDEIRKRVENFRKHQEQFSREREEYASSILRILRTVNPVAK